MHLPKGFSPFLITQALGAFNDNFFKMLIQLYVLVIVFRPDSKEIIAGAALVFTIPFVLFGPWAGYLADKYSKSKMIQWIKICEIGVMILGVLAFYWQSIPLLLFVLFLMATQSAFFSPAKAGFIPESCPAPLISKANGLMGMTTFFSIILGTALAGLVLANIDNNTLLASTFCILIAVLGSLSSLMVTKIPASKAVQKFPLNPFSGIFRDLLFLKKQKGLFLAALANSYFWLLGLIFQTNIVVYGEVHLGLGAKDNAWISLLPALMGVGIALGSILAARWSGKKVEIGLVPLGGIGLTLSGIALYFTSQSYVATAIALTLAGVFGGLYIIPLNAYLQFTARESEKGRVIATAGVMNGLFLVLGSLAYRLFSVEWNWSPALICLIMGVVSLFVTIYICTVVPEYFLRFSGWLTTHSLYRIRIIGLENVPKEGGALLVPNHVSYVDAIILGATIQRFIKFIMYKKIYDIPVIKQLCKIMDVNPIAPYEGRDSVTQSLKLAQEQLQKGELVCIFAEGGITRNGEMQEFKGGLESIMQDQNSPIIPVYLHNLWGSLFSFESGKVFWKWPKKIPYPVTIVYGKPLPSHSSAKQVQEAVKELQAQMVL